MQAILTALEDFQRRSTAIFDKVDEAASRTEAQLQSLEARLSRASAVIEAAKGSTQPLVVESSRSLGPQQRLEASGGSSRVIDDGDLKALGKPVLLPEAGALGSKVSAREAAEDLARVIRSLATPPAGGSMAHPAPSAHSRLLPPDDRLGSLSELMLFNSCEEPYKEYSHVDNLTGAAALPLEEEVQPPAAAAASGVQQPSLRLDEDEPELGVEDLRFIPKPAARVTLNLPDVLPSLGGRVAEGVVFRQDEAIDASSQRPAWHDPMSRLQRRAPPPPRPRPVPENTSAALAATPVTIAPLRPPPPRAPKPSPPPPKQRQSAQQEEQQQQQQQQPQKTPPPVPQPPKPKPQPVAPTPAVPPSVAAAPKAEAGSAAAEEQVEQVKSSPPPPPAPGKGKGKKGKGKPPPPPPKGAGPPAPPPPPKDGKGKGSGKSGAPAPASDKSAMLADIRKGASLRKVGPPKEKSLGRVLD